MQNFTKLIVCVFIFFGCYAQTHAQGFLSPGSGLGDSQNGNVNIGLDPFPPARLRIQTLMSMDGSFDGTLLLHTESSDNGISPFGIRQMYYSHFPSLETPVFEVSAVGRVYAGDFSSLKPLSYLNALYFSGTYSQYNNFRTRIWFHNPWG